MAVIEMVPEKDYGEGNINAGFVMQYKDQVSTPGNGDWILFPRGSDRVIVILAATGTGRVEGTTASKADIDADTVVTNEIEVWPHGDISGDKKSVAINGCTAFRAVSVSGAVNISAVAVN